MPTLSNALARLSVTLLATRGRRLALWGLVAGGFGTVGAVLAASVLSGEPPSAAGRLVMDALALGADVLVYALLAWAWRRRSLDTADPLRALWAPLVAGLVLLGLEVGIGWWSDGRIDPKTLLPTDTLTVALASFVGVAEGVVGVGMLLSLRPLILYRRRRWTVRVWRVFLGLILVTGIVNTGWPPRAIDTPLQIGALALTLGLGLLLALRQGWVVSLSLRDRAFGALLAVGLAAVCVGLLSTRTDADVTLDAPTIAHATNYAEVFSMALESAFEVTAAFVLLYAVTSAFVLLFQLPAATGLAQRAGERRAFRTLADLSGRVLDRGRLVDAIARGPVDGGLGDAAWLALADIEHGTLEPRVVASVGIARERAAAAADVDALADGGSLVLTHAAADHRVTARPGDGIGSLAVLPLATGGERQGALLVARDATDAFEADDLAALETFASQAALALSHADLFQETLERERLARELALARDVQRRLLPASLPELPGVELAAAEQPAREVGGDYYDVVEIDDGCLGIVVADVAGKGAAAAFYMAELKGIVQSASRLTRSPGEFLARASDALAPSLAAGVFVSLVYAVLDTETGQLTLARAGHCPPVLARDDARADGGRWLLRPGGLALGLGSGALFRRTLREQVVHLAPGDTVALYTDGLVEARDAGGAEYGYDRLADAVARQRHTSALDIRDALLADLAAWSDGAEAADDVAVVVVRWTGADASRPAPAGGPPVSETDAFPLDSADA